MNDNLDDWLNSIGVPIDPDVRETVPAVQDEESASPEPNQPQSLTENDFDDILGEFGFSRPEDVQAEEIQEEESEEEEEEEESTSSESLEDERNTFNAAAAASFIRRHIGGAVITFVGNEELVNIGDFRVNPYTGRVEVLTDNGIVSIEQTVIDRETRDLDAEEDADWQEAIDSGEVVPVFTQAFEEGIVNGETVIRVDSDGSVHNSSMSEMADAVHFHMPDGEVIDVPIVTEEQASQAQNPEAAQRQEPLIPLNSPTLLLDESTTRFSGAEWFNEIQKKSIIFGGIGGIGSNCCFQLARMHPAAIFMYDDDNVETVNMAGQLYSRNDVGRSKVSAISDMIASYTNMQNVFALNQRFTSNTEAGDIMMCGFDNMEARKTFFEAWAAHIENKSGEEKKNCLFLDGRLSMDTLQVICITGDDYANQVRYVKEFLFSDSDAEHTVCSMKQTTYLACMIGSIMVNLFTNWCANLLDPIIPYDLPFFTEYDAQNMIFKTVK